MPKLRLSIKALKFRSIIVSTLLIAFIVVIVYSINFIIFTLNSFTKGVTLLQKYTEEYFIFKSEEGSKLISQEKYSEITRKFEGFFVFDDLLNFRDRNYKEIEKIWLDFGMEKDEIKVVVFFTKIFRQITTLASDIKDASSKIRTEYENVFLKNQKVDIEKIINIISNLNKSFFKTINKITLIFTLLLILVSITIISTLIYLTFRDTNALSKILETLPKTILEALEGKYRRVEILDEKSSKELYILQDATNKTISKFEELDEKRKETKQNLMYICNHLENFVIELSEIASEGKEHISLIEENKIEELIKIYSKLSQILSRTMSDIENLYQNFDKFRSSSIKIFEPISTIYDIIERINFEYKNYFDIISNYTKDTTIFIESIKKHLNLNKENIEKALSDLSRASQKLRSIGINSSIEFSRIGISGSESLKNISSKIIELSKNLSQIFGEVSLTISETSIKVTEDVEKISAFINSVKENEKKFLSFHEALKDINVGKEKTKKDIEDSYTLLSDIINTFQKLQENKENIIQEFYEFEVEIEKTIEIISNLGKIKTVFSELEKLLEIVQSNLDNLKVTCDNL